MGILRRLTDATKAGLSDLKSRSFGSSNKPLAELSDRELEEVLLRRRRERAGKRHGQRRDDRDPESPQNKQLHQYYANLELKPGASLDKVKAAYRDLMRKYHPDKHLGDPDRHKAATELAQSLTKAYQVLLARSQGDADT